jgi:hypothetical protein
MPMPPILSPTMALLFDLPRRLISWAEPLIPLSQGTTRRVPSFHVLTSAYPITLCYSGRLLPNGCCCPPPLSMSLNVHGASLTLMNFVLPSWIQFYVDRMSGLTTSINWSTYMTVSDPWFDYECRVVKRTTRRLERVYSAAARRSAARDTDVNVCAAEAAWRAQRVKYRNLRQYKRRTFWLTTV